VKNLALPGAQMDGGLFMAGKLSPDDRLVLIELAGTTYLTIWLPTLSNVTSMRCYRTSLRQAGRS